MRFSCGHRSGFDDPELKRDLVKLSLQFAPVGGTCRKRGRTVARMRFQAHAQRARQVRERGGSIPCCCAKRLHCTADLRVVACHRFSNADCGDERRNSRGVVRRTLVGGSFGFNHVTIVDDKCGRLKRAMGFPFEALRDSGRPEARSRRRAATVAGALMVRWASRSPGGESDRSRARRVPGAMR